MGQDKALMPFLGMTLLEWVMKRVSNLGDELFITTNNPRSYQDFKVPLYQDVQLGTGALGGLLTALNYAQNPLLVVVACDMPFVNPEMLAMAIDKLQSEHVDVVIPQSKNGYEPFHAVYRHASCLPAVKSALEAGERKLISWFPKVKVLPIDEIEIQKFDPLQIAFWNVNTEDDLKQAQQLAKQLNL